MKLKVISLALISVISSSLLASNDCAQEVKIAQKEYKDSSKYLNKRFKYNIANRNGIGLAKDMGGAKGLAQIIALRHGDLKNNIRNLQLPDGSIDINNGWVNIVYNMTQYLKGAKTKEELFLRTTEVSSIFENGVIVKDSIPYITKVLLKEKGDIPTNVYQALYALDKKAKKKGLERFIIFSSMTTSPGADFANKYLFKGHDKKMIACMRENLMELSK